MCTRKKKIEIIRFAKKKTIFFLTGISQTPHIILKGFTVRAPFVSAGTKEDDDAAIDSNNSNNGAGA